MSSWIFDGVERVCAGTQVRYGEHPSDSVTVSQTPSEVRSRMLSGKEDMLEFHHEGSGEPLYIDPAHIIALTPFWKKFEETETRG
jgi:hypothetical protein